MRQYDIPKNRFRNFYHFFELTSTMDECVNFIEKGIGSGIVLADSQTAGYGRGKKSWSSADNGNIYLSFFEKIDPASPLSLIPQRCAVASLSAVKPFVSGASALIKWPNDILIDSKKVSGVIAKQILFGRRRFYICGIGINVFPPEIGAEKFVWEPVSVSDYDKKIDTGDVVSKLVASIDSAFSASPDEILRIYSENVAWMVGRRIVYTQDYDARLEGEICGFSSDFSALKIGDGAEIRELSSLSILSLD